MFVPFLRRAGASVPLSAPALFVLLELAGFSAATPAQQIETSVVVTDGDPASTDKVFGLAVDPDGTHVYAALCGDLSFSSPQTANNDDVVKIDVFGGVQIATGHVGLYPEEIAVLVDPSGVAARIYVSNSTDGTISCLTPDLATTLATIPVSPCFGSVYFGAFPYGLLLSQDQKKLYVTTIGGCDAIDVVDVDPTSATFHQLVGSFAVPGASGRPTWRNATEMAIPVTTYDATFTNSQAGFAIVDPSNPSAYSVSYATSPTSLGYYSANEAVVTSGDTVLIPIYGGSNATIVELSASTGAIVRSAVLPAAATSPSVLGLALSPDGSTVAATSFTGNDVFFLDYATFAWTGLVDLGQSAQPNEVVFTRDGSRAVVSLQGLPRVDVIKDLPGYDLALDVPATIAQGASASVLVRRVEYGTPYAVFVSATAGPLQFGPHTVYLGLPFFELFSGLGSVDGTGGTGVFVPATPGLSGAVFHLQAAAVDRDGDVRLSNGASTLVL
jgi:DNA-binding beta-propeller fold protein YncE